MIFGKKMLSSLGWGPTCLRGVCLRLFFPLATVAASSLTITTPYCLPRAFTHRLLKTIMAFHFSVCVIHFNNIFSYFFYFEIISGLQKNCRNNTENVYLSFTQFLQINILFHFLIYCTYYCFFEAFESNLQTQCLFIPNNVVASPKNAFLYVCIE